LKKQIEEELLTEKKVEQEELGILDIVSEIKYHDVFSLL
jgi:hypothetical protein